jgi:hypothetical protein
VNVGRNVQQTLKRRHLFVESEAEKFNHLLRTLALCASKIRAFGEFHR